MRCRLTPKPAGSSASRFETPRATTHWAWAQELAGRGATDVRRYLLAHHRLRTSLRQRAGLWNKRFPGLIPETIVLPEKLDGDTLRLEGQELVVVDVGHTDIDDTTCLYAPSVDLVVAGDLAYNDVHQYFAESAAHEKRMEWIAALDKIEALKPKVVIAGHKRESNGDGPNVIEETRQYIRDFDRLVDKTSTTLELYNAMLSLYPDRLNRGALWGSARALKG
jgi:glyoxylase-like metal-dependent hydrolase (beta-lactamase superfamily II)